MNINLVIDAALRGLPIYAERNNQKRIKIKGTIYLTHTYPKTKTPEEELDYKISVMQAFRDGKKIQRRADKFWGADWIYDETPCWDWCNFSYRIAPEKKKVPMTAEDFPPNFYLRQKSCNTDWYPTQRISPGYGIKFDDVTYTFQELCECGIEYSTDRKEVKGCWKVENQSESRKNKNMPKSQSNEFTRRQELF